MPYHFLCALAEIQQHSEREFTLTVQGKTISLCIIHRQHNVHAYLNQCPHTGVNLNWMPHQFLDVEQQYIQCGTHGALFRIEDGYCVRGPCAGASLKKINVKIERKVEQNVEQSLEQKNVYLEIPD